MQTVASYKKKKRKTKVMTASFTGVRLFFSFIELYDDHSRHSIFQQVLNSYRTPGAWFKHPHPTYTSSGDP